MSICYEAYDYLGVWDVSCSGFPKHGVPFLQAKLLQGQIAGITAAPYSLKTHILGLCRNKSALHGKLGWNGICRGIFRW